MSKVKLKTRFCPSPTGMLHLGNVRTALFNALLAKGQQGVFLLRIEDTDRTRSDIRYTEALQVDLRWLGLDWDEGPGRGGDAGPYWQSQRQAIYDKYYAQLEEKGFAYPCFCSEQQLALARKVQRASGKPPRYPGTCRALTREEVAQKLAQGLKPTLRFRITHDQETVFNDLVRGEQRFNNNDIGDFIIRRADGTPPFMYCNAIDDALMGVTHALRGEDHLTNTPRQIMILRALNLPIPTYGHISLIMGHDGTPLSKRHGSRSLQELREQGYLPVAIINYLARLGHYYPEEVLMSFDELAAKFALKSLGAAPARFDAHQLLHWQHEAVAHMDADSLWKWLGSKVHQQVAAASKDIFINSIKHNVTFPVDAEHWAKVFFAKELYYSEEAQNIIRDAGQEFFEVTLQALNSHGANFQAISDELKKVLKVKGKALFQPLRVALTGEQNGPELVHIFELLGDERIKHRLQTALMEAKRKANV